MSIESLQAEEKALRARLRDVERRLNEARIAAAPFKVGDVVEANNRGSWEPAIIREVEVSSFSCWYRVSFRAKSGDWQNRAVRVFSEVRQPETTPA